MESTRGQEKNIWKETKLKLRACELTRVEREQVIHVDFACLMAGQVEVVVGQVLHYSTNQQVFQDKDRLIRRVKFVV